jgi:GrpB-like predicted nucleotidyltransferase (UPF0157 family)
VRGAQSQSLTVLGLQYGTVALVDHDPAWAREFASERRLLAEALAGAPCEIEHVGSTAVAGLIAKPILDIAIGVADAPQACIARLEALGYLYRGDAGANPAAREPGCARALRRREARAGRKIRARSQGVHCREVRADRGAARRPGGLGSVDPRRSSHQDSHRENRRGSMQKVQRSGGRPLSGPGPLGV